MNSMLGSGKFFPMLDFESYVVALNIVNIKKFNFINLRMTSSPLACYLSGHSSFLILRETSKMSSDI